MGKEEGVRKWTHLSLKQALMNFLNFAKEFISESQTTQIL